MKYYSIAEIDITDRSWVAAYVRDVTPMLERHGGRYLARTSNFERMEGERKAPQLLLLVEWPSKEAAIGFYQSAEYQPYLQARLGGSRGQFYLAAAEDINGVAQIER
jgi:uncharacterized protein (DUF1330 family)